MNRKSLLSLVMVLLLIVSMTSIVAAQQEEPAAVTVSPESTVPPPWWNMLCNGSFEAGGTNPDCWSKNTFNAGAQFKWDSSVAYDGQKSAKITLTSLNDSRWIQTIPVQQHTDYVLSGWIKTQNVTGIAGANLSLPMGVFIHTPPLTGTNDWTFRKVVFNTGSWSEIIVGARLGMYGDMSTGTAWFDKIQLAPVKKLYVSSSQSGTVAGVRFAPGDVLVHNPVLNTWAMYFDASDLGITRNIDAFDLPEGDFEGAMIFSLGSAQIIPGLGTVRPEDVVLFVPTSTGDTTAGTLSMFMDGSANGLNSASENIDALELDPYYSMKSPGPYAALYISTTGAFVAPGVSSGRDEDIFGGSPWWTFLTGSTVPGLGPEDVWGFSCGNADCTSDVLYLSTQDTYYPGDGRSITNKQIFAIQMGSPVKVLKPIFWSGPDHGFNYVIDGFSLED